MKDKKTIGDIPYEKLTEKQREQIWKLIDNWYENTDLWDLLELSGIAETPLDELDKSVEEITAFIKVEEKFLEEFEECSCMKCGKIISQNESDDYKGMCATCWHERN